MKTILLKKRFAVFQQGYASCRIALALLTRLQAEVYVSRRTRLVEASSISLVVA